MKLPSHQASDITVLHKLRECLNHQRADREELDMKVPMVAEVRDGDTLSHVRFGSQFCVRVRDAVLEALRNQAFSACCSNGVVFN